MKLDSVKLRRIMAAKNFNVSRLAEAANLSPAAINNWLNHGTNPRIDTVGRLAKALEVDIFDLMEDDLQ